MATSALTALGLKGERADWVVAREYSQILRGHPSVGRIWEFDRKSGLRGWLRLSRSLADAGYAEVLDLHRTQRTMLLKAVLRMRQGSSVRIRTLSKQRLRTYGYYVLKKLWPRLWRPSSYASRFSLLAGGSPELLGDLKHLAADANLPRELLGQSYVCVMPSSRWPGKIWSAAGYAEVLARTQMLPVVMGTHSDRASLELVELLKKAGKPHVSGIGKWSLNECAVVLASARAYLGNDTGLAHLAEAVGTKAFMVLGPTVPDLGYGPNRSESRAIGQDLWCRPCGKDGRNCHRIVHRHACLTRLSPDEVAEQLIGELNP